MANVPIISESNGDPLNATKIPKSDCCCWGGNSWTELENRIQ